MMTLSNKLELIENQISDFQLKIMDLENQKEALESATSEINHCLDAITNLDDEIKNLAIAEILNRLGIGDYKIITCEPDKPEKQEILEYAVDSLSDLNDSQLIEFRDYLENLKDNPPVPEDQLIGDVEEIKILSQEVIITGENSEEIPKPHNHDPELVSEMRRVLNSLKWDMDMGKKFLDRTYGKGYNSPLELDPDELKEFVAYFKGLLGTAPNLTEPKGNYDLAHLGLAVNYDDLIVGINPDHGISFNFDSHNPEYINLSIRGKFKNEISEIFKLLFEFADSENLTSVVSDNICEKTEHKLKYNQLLFLSEADFPVVWEFLKAHWLDVEKKQELEITIPTQEITIPIDDSSEMQQNQNIFDDKNDYELIDDLLHLLKDKFSTQEAMQNYLRENYRVGSVRILNRDQLIDAIGKLTLEHLT